MGRKVGVIAGQYSEIRSVFTYGDHSVEVRTSLCESDSMGSFPIGYPKLGDIMHYDSRGTKIDTNECVEKIGNRFDLILVATARAREIKRLNKNSNRFEHTHAPVTALLEIQEGKIDKEYLKKV